MYKSTKCGQDRKHQSCCDSEAKSVGMRDETLEGAAVDFDLIAILNT
jgi:hypothetical protein